MSSPLSPSLSESSPSSILPGPSEASFWANRWTKGETQWHKSFVHPDLLRHRNFLGTPSPSSPSRILVPLCGKTLDLKYLYQEGFIVIGIEFIQSAIIDFFNENQALFPSYHHNKNASADGSIESYSSLDGRLTIIRADLFSPLLTPSLIGGAVNCVWDRGSLVAIDPKDRFKYWKKILLLGGVTIGEGRGIDEKNVEEKKEGLRILLNVFSYNQLEKKGPPFSVSHQQLNYLLKNSEGEGKEEGITKSDNEEEVTEVVNGVIKEKHYCYELVNDEWYTTEKDKMRTRIYQIVYYQ